jgi:hypothetical protein
VPRIDARSGGVSCFLSAGLAIFEPARENNCFARPCFAVLLVLLRLDIPVSCSALDRWRDRVTKKLRFGIRYSHFARSELTPGSRSPGRYPPP